MPSPIIELMHPIAASPFRVAPAAIAALEAVIASKSIKLELSLAARTEAKLIISTKLVHLGIPFLEVLWAAAHAYIVIFQECQHANARGEVMFSIGERPRTAKAYALYRTLLTARAAGELIDWPSLEIRPERLPSENSDVFIANEVFLVAVSWLIHHEIAHARLGHQAELKVLSLQEEQQADQEASQWVFQESAEPLASQKRAMGVVTAVLVLIACELEKPPTHSNSHPPSFERLIVNLDAAGLEENAMPYAFAFKLVEIHLLQSGVPHEIERTGTFREMLVSACLLLRDSKNAG